MVGALRNPVHPVADHRNQEDSVRNRVDLAARRPSLLRVRATADRQAVAMVAGRVVVTVDVLRNLRPRRSPRLDRPRDHLHIIVRLPGTGRHRRRIGLRIGRHHRRTTSAEAMDGVCISTT